ncbi:MAG: hypothetical protein QGG54_18330, partial [Gammaproteobacteria bacterium]|nr:hypothetical protein [Gammaproteobacteria bacterium]
QLASGAFSELTKLGPPEPLLDQSAFDDSRTYREVGINRLTTPWYLSRVHEMDFNLDSRSDLVFWNRDHFEVYYQDSSGQFSTDGDTFTTDVEFEADGIHSYVFGYDGENMFSLLLGFRAKCKRTALHSFRDMNGDGISDLVTQSIEGRSLLRQRSSYAVHFGSPTSNGVAFASDASMILQPQASAEGGSPLGYSLGWLEDFDGDGQIDFGYGRVNTGITGFFSALVVNSISIDIEFYKIVDGVYPESPNGLLKIKPDREFFLGGRGPFFPTVMLGDVNGDERADLLVGENWEELTVYTGVSSPALLASEPRIIPAAMTANGEQDARVVNLNRDNKQDVTIHHPNAEPQKLVVLVAR